MVVVHDRSGQSTGQLVEMFHSQLDRSVEICDLLEALADELPKRSRSVWRAAKLQCHNVLKEHLALGAEKILPQLLLNAQNTQFHRGVLLRLKSEYSVLAGRAEDLDDLFHDAVETGPNTIGSEALGYALRGHFDALRSSIGWEGAILQPMIAQHCGPGELLPRAAKGSHHDLG